MPFNSPRALVDVAPMPWKNGRGSTRELRREPAGSGLRDFVWRVSVADVEADGPFSTFDGIDRTLVLLDGDGLNLHLEDGARRALTTPFEPMAFAGEQQVQVTLPGGATRDFNLMVRRGMARGRIAIHSRLAPVLLEPSVVLLFVARGKAQVVDTRGGVQRLGRDDSVCLDPNRARPRLLCGGDTVVLAVHIDRT